MSRRNDQSKFVKMVALLILYAYEIGYTLTFGDAYTQEKEVKCPKCEGMIKIPDGHSRHSFHRKRLAIDLNLFKDGKYLTETEDHRPLGEFWISLGGTWGGDFHKPDGNHYSYLE